jgi:pimeloyl-ACP methyl ester carboxylesterase
VPTATASDGATIAYEVTGAGPALVLVHGITESHHTWDPLVEPLALDFRVIAVDLRGHGESERKPPYDAFTMANDVYAVVQAAGATEPLLVGHSLGAVVISLYAASRPLRGVVNIDQTLALGEFKELLTSIEPMLRGDKAGFRSVISGMFDGMDGPLPTSERERIDSHSRPEQGVVLGVWDLVLHTDAAVLEGQVTAIGRAITAPYLALHGRDPGKTYADWFDAFLPHATLEVWPDRGHYPHLVEPERFLDRLHDFEHSL